MMTNSQPSAPIPPFEPLPFAFARRNKVLLITDDEHNTQLIYQPETEHLALLEAIRKEPAITQLTKVDAEQFEQQLQEQYQKEDFQAQKVVEDIHDEFNLSQIAQQLSEPTDLLEAADDAPIIRLINALLSEAISENASDIHIDPYEQRLLIRMRVDGELRNMIQPPLSIAPLIVSRIKIMAKLDISEKRLPMDGRISVRIANRPVDLRVSTMPSGLGERVVLRILDKQAGRLQLEQIGMAPKLISQLDRLIHKPHGIILVTGPTGSGKTTTLYAALSRLNSAKRNIMTIEDPIEYNLDGIAQAQVNNKIDFSFARGLKAILRQDPDVVMIGEIRDSETAQIAIQASLTGHLVLSTLHTNSATGAITRLQDMGTEPFLLSSSLLAVLSQRLLRTLCTNCREPYQSSPTECETLGVETPVKLYRPIGCNLCGQSGYRGRTGIHELVEIDEPLQRIIHDEAPQYELEKKVFSTTQTLQQSGLDKVLNGSTSFDELLRVTHEG